MKNRPVFFSIVFVIGTLTLFLFPKMVSAQQKYRTETKSKWVTNGRLNTISVSRFGGTNEGWRLDLFSLRIYYAGLGLFSGWLRRWGKDTENDPPGSLRYLFPIELSFPLKAGKRHAFSVNSTSYLISYEGHSKITELALRYEGLYHSLSAGYRFQSRESKDRYDGLFLEASVGFSAVFHWDEALENDDRNFGDAFFDLTDMVNKEIGVERRVALPNPALNLSVNLTPSGGTLLAGEQMELDVIIENKGKGLAEDLTLTLSADQQASSKVLFPSTQSFKNPSLEPRSKRNIRVPIAAMPDIEKKETVKLTLVCNEKDGFKAEKTVEITLVPKSQREKFPPVLVATAQLREPNGNGLLDANEKGEIELTIRNEGKGAAWNLETNLELTGSSYFQGLSSFERSFPIRQIKPQSSQNLRIPIAAGMDIATANLEFNITFKEANGFEPSPIKLTFGTQAFIAPSLVIVEVGINDADGENSSGNGDSKIQPNETIETTVVIQNRGQGKAKDVKAVVKIDDQNIFYHGENIYNFGDLEAGEYRMFKFPFVVNNRYAGSVLLPISLEVIESWGKYGVFRSLGLELNKVTLAAKKIQIEGKKFEKKEIPEPPALRSEVEIDQNIPKTASLRSDAIAVIIGNRDYIGKDIPTVDFALRDAAVMKEYVVKTLGYREGNVIYIENATKAQLEATFGTVTDHRGRLFNVLKSGISEVFVYYSGHGAPDIESRQGYIVPVDCDPSLVRLNGYSLNTFYANLAKLKVKSMMVVIDACFSGVSAGGSLLGPMSPVGIVVVNPLLNLPNAMIFTSADTNQVSSWHAESKHSLFTYFFLRGLRGEADKDGNKSLTFQELADFVTNEIEGVPYWAKRLHNRDQTPMVIGKDMHQVLVRY